MQIFFKDIVDKQTNKPAVIACHGPSLNDDLEKILELQQKGELIRFSLNNWYDFIEPPPDYWVLASSIDVMPLFVDKINKFKIPTFFADTVDPVSYSFLEENVKADFLGYDQKHFQNHTCTQILANFVKFYKQTGSVIGFKEYGNNEVMWYPPRSNDGAGFHRKGGDCTRIQASDIIMKELNQTTHGNYDLEWEAPKVVRLTIQEKLQQVSNHSEHYSTGDTVALHAIAFAIIMGCNPIYVSGMDLDYQKGYANNQAAPSNNDWQRLNANLMNDLRIINESAEKRNIKIINLKSGAWYNILEEGKIT
jgi:hypothetical protein